MFSSYFDITRGYMEKVSSDSVAQYFLCDTLVNAIVVPEGF